MTRIIVFGATGYTGGMVARAIIADGGTPVLAGRSRERLVALADELGGPEIVVADAAEPDGTIRRLLGSGDVLVSTVGPFLRFGAPAVRAAVDAGAHYLDSTGEPPFIRWVFEEMDARARGRCALLPAFGFDFLPGNLAGALALREAGTGARRIDVGYFSAGAGGLASVSEGTARSTAGMLFEPSFAWRDGRLREVRSAERVATFGVDGRELDAISVGGSEHLTLPRLATSLREVNVHLGWFGPWSRALQRASAGTDLLGRVPGVRWLSRTVGAEVAARVVGASSGGDAPTMGTSRVVAVAYDGSGRRLTDVHLEGPEAYRFTGDALAWAARRAATAGPEATGALGPVEAFGLDTLADACAAIGLSRVDG